MSGLKETQKKNCNRCRAFSESGCKLGYTKEGAIPKEPCLKPLTMAEIKQAEELRKTATSPCESESAKGTMVQETTRVVYLVDTENVGRSFIPLLMEPEDDATYILFCTEHSPLVPLALLPKVTKNLEQFQFIECCTPGQNALDFQLISYMGYLMKEAPTTKYVVLSKDMGYDSAIRFWQLRGYDVKRREPVPYTMGKESLTAGSINEQTTKALFIENGIAEVDAAELVAIITAHRKNKSAIYQECIKKFGQEKGINIYKSQKEIISLICLGV